MIGTILFWFMLAWLATGISFGLYWSVRFILLDGDRSVVESTWIIVLMTYLALLLWPVLLYLNTKQYLRENKIWLMKCLPVK